MQIPIIFKETKPINKDYPVYLDYLKEFKSTLNDILC